ncbi:MAG: aldehyde dehydrogenase family protein, partial [Verrucomicrobiota bacterium]
FERLRGLGPAEATRIGEDRPDELQFAPTIIPNADWDSPAMKEEIFGPILPVLGFSEIDDVTEKIRNHSAPLAVYVFSRSRETQERVAAAIPSGTVCFNDALKQATNLQLPFGGVGASGYGRYRGRAGLENFSHQQAVTRRWFNKDPFLIAPPYGDELERLRKILR